MIFWIGLIITLIIISVIGWAMVSKYSYLDKKNLIGTIMGAVGAIGVLLVFVGLICETQCYNSFEVSHQIHQEQIAVIAEKLENDELDTNSLLFVADIVDSNEKLVNYQARYMRFGNLSMIPARVMDIEPLWLVN